MNKNSIAKIFNSLTIFVNAKINNILNAINLGKNHVLNVSNILLLITVEDG